MVSLWWPSLLSRRVRISFRLLQHPSDTSAADREHSDSLEFRRFRRQLFHSLISYILQSLKPGMTTPEIVCYANGHYRRTIYGLGPYIGDYPKQVLLACCVQGWCARYVSRFAIMIFQIVIIAVWRIATILMDQVVVARMNIPRPPSRACHQSSSGTSTALSTVSWYVNSESSSSSCV